MELSTLLPLHRWFPTLGLALLLGCSTVPMGRGDLLDFLEDGVTTRDEVMLRLGDPTAVYEAERIVTYRLTQDQGGWVLLGRGRGWYGVVANLVVVFDERNVLERHAIVQVHSP